MREVDGVQNTLEMFYYEEKQRECEFRKNF